MKNFIIILICIILGYVLYSLIWKYNSFIFGANHFKYQDCNIKYRQEHIKKSSLTDFDNLWIRDNARTDFIKCLCDKYVISKDTFIKGYVEREFKSTYWYQNNYIINLQGLDTAILMQYRDNIFRNDQIGRNAISNYHNDTLTLMKALSARFYEDNIIQQEYFNFIPSVNVPIDTLIKYKEIIFKLPFRYGDA